MLTSRATRWLQRCRESDPNRRHLAMSTLSKLFLAILVASTAFVFTGSHAGRPAYADEWCSCLVYIQKLLGLPGGIGCADQAGSYLHAAGYVQTPYHEPRVGAVVVFQRGFPGVDKDCGHIGIVQSFQSVNGDRDWQLVMRSAAWNGDGTDFSDAGCNDVSDDHKTYSKDLWAGVNYWFYVGPPRSPDINHDGQVDILDFSVLLTHWNRTGDDPADFNRDGIVDVLDFSYLLSNWGRTGLAASSPDFVSTAAQSQGSSTSSPRGPIVQVGAPSMVAGQVQVSMYARGTGFDPYMAFSVHLQWDPAVLALDDVKATGGLFESPTGACAGPIVDSDGGGAIFACAFLDVQGTTETGLLATFSLTPRASGCSRLHLATLGPPDNGNSLTGTLTVDDADITAQANEYEDGFSDAEGEPCSPGPNPTPTPTATPAPTPTPEPAFTPTPPSGATRTLHWSPGWHNAMWTGAASTPEEAFVCADGKYAAAYGYVGGGFRRYFPDHPDISNMTGLEPYDTFFILVTDDVTCEMPVADPPETQHTLDWAVGWHNEGWSGPDGTAPRDAFACADGNYAAAYRYVDEALERFFPDRPGISNMGPLDRYDPFLILVTAPVSCNMVVAR